MLVGPAGRICHHDCPAAARKSMNSCASFPRFPIPYGDGREDTGNRIPLLRFIFIILSQRLPRRP